MNLYVASLNSFGDADPVDTWGRPKHIGIDNGGKKASVIFRGSRVGMLQKINSSVLETRFD
ncbi:MAG: hypothetical protein ABIE74_05970 [Pseudomonadota bacterium]